MSILDDKWNKYVKDFESLYIFGDVMGKIKKYDKELFINMRNLYYKNIPASMLILNNNFVQGHCYDRAKLLAYVLGKDSEIVIADVDGLRYKPEYIEKRMLGELKDNYAEHCFVEKKDDDGIVWVYDTSLGLIIEKTLYYKMQHPTIKERTREDILLKEIEIDVYNEEDLYMNKEYLKVVLPTLKKMYEPIRKEYNELGIEEIDKILISLDETNASTKELIKKEN